MCQKDIFVSLVFQGKFNILIRWTFLSLVNYRTQVVVCLCMYHLMGKYVILYTSPKIIQGHKVQKCVNYQHSILNYMKSNGSFVVHSISFLCISITLEVFKSPYNMHCILSYYIDIVYCWPIDQRLLLLPSGFRIKILWLKMSQ